MSISHPATSCFVAILPILNFLVSENDDIEKKIDLPKNLYYRIWSMTKPIVSLAAMQLIEKNYLSLDDQIDKYFVDCKKIKILSKIWGNY